MNDLLNDLVEKGIISDIPQTEPSPFTQNRDKVGLPVDSKVYASAKCNTCYGRGIMRVLLKDRRSIQVCDCVVKGYTAVRLFLKALPEASREGFAKEIRALDRNGGTYRQVKNVINATR